MSAIPLEQRVAALEAEVARLKSRLESKEKKETKDWLDVVWGAFAGDPAFEEAMRLGREYRESLRPKPTRRRRRT
ncbi:MAG TPA: hypothetical protein VFA26_19045 [Gemmataceae bacterium]|nr:hypothetical protein [Gemmataceae bacterium]